MYEYKVLINIDDRIETIYLEADYVQTDDDDFYIFVADEQPTGVFDRMYCIGFLRM